MLRRCRVVPGPFILFRYLESDWRNPIDRERDAARSKDVLQQLTNGTEGVGLAHAAQMCDFAFCDHDNDDRHMPPDARRLQQHGVG